jgi:hypothetical protein
MKSNNGLKYLKSWKRYVEEEMTGTLEAKVKFGDPD